ncbi:unnamed protein product, partial [Urochloa humidicola]
VTWLAATPPPSSFPSLALSASFPDRAIQRAREKSSSRGIGRALLVEAADHGVLGDHAHLPPRRRRRLPLHAPLLQPRAIHQPIPFYLGDHGCNLLLDDVCDRLPCSDESFDQPHPEWGVSFLLKRIKSDMLYHYSVCEPFIHFGPPENKETAMRFFATLPPDYCGGTL